MPRFAPGRWDSSPHGTPHLHVGRTSNPRSLSTPPDGLHVQRSCLLGDCATADARVATASIGLPLVALGLAFCTSSGASQQRLVPASDPSPFSARCVGPDAVEPCYTALQLQKAYNLKPLYSMGLDGSGTTVVVLAARVSPTLVHDLAVFDEAFRLQTPSIRVVSPAGTVPARFDPDSIQAAVDFSAERCSAGQKPGPACDEIIRHCGSRHDSIHDARATTSEHTT